MKNLKMIFVCILLIFVGVILSDALPSVLDGSQSILHIMDKYLKPIFFLLATSFTIYLGYQKIGNKVKATYTVKSERFRPCYISSVVLTNCKDKPLIVKSILAELPDNKHVSLIKLTDPIVLSAYSSTKVDIPPFSKLSLEGKEYKTMFLKVKIIIESDSKYIKCEEPHIIYGLSSTLIRKSNRKFNGFIHDETLKYALVYYVNDKVYTAFISDIGFLGNEWEYGQCLIANNGGPININNIRQMLKENLIKEWVLYDLNKSNGGRAIYSSGNE
ncbi:hypothetical protein VOI46_09505 [Pseudoalteromonas sp. CuT4-3]|uniref:hypothetical protein n=1 Tax=Pseudoalteromonas sp. CuT4-3 TaxID=3112573 RepID=UPI002D78FA28|nr:hypothetical protein [Pseudoalteromonas sp. CuT 4-3]WRU71768.1 hypothetical protein VOI46_09505 [Pseudoalteromonas sp. CuT 4-3]